MFLLGVHYYRWTYYRFIFRKRRGVGGAGPPFLIVVALDEEEYLRSRIIRIPRTSNIVRVFSVLRVISILIIITLFSMLNIKPEILIAITTRGTITYREQSDYNYDDQDDDDY